MHRIMHRQFFSRSLVFCRSLGLAGAFGHALAVLTLAGAAALLTPVTLRAQPFATPDPEFKGRTATARPLVLAGDEVELKGSRYTPGQRIVLSSGADRLNAEPIIVGADGSFQARFQVPAATAPGIHPIVVSATQPTAAHVFDLKVSPTLPFSGEEQFTQVKSRLVGSSFHSLYQAAYSAKHQALFVTQAMGRPPVKASNLLKVNPDTLTIEKTAAVAAVPGHADGSVYAVYGVAVDDANDHVWVTNSRQGTLAVYRQTDLSLVKQFPANIVPHARDVIVDAARGRAYASATGGSTIAVFDTRKLRQIETIEIKSGSAWSKFVPTSLELDRAAGKLYTVSLETPEAAIVDLASSTVEKIVPLPRVRSAIGVAYDPRSKRLFAAAQGSDNLVIIDTVTGNVVKDVPVGGGALNVAFDPATSLAYVTNRTAGTIAVVDPDGALLANFRIGTLPNHVHEDGRGSVFVVTMDEQGDHITRLTRKP